MSRLRRQIFPVVVAFGALASALEAQVELIAGFNFGQFVFSGAPSTDGLNGSPAGSIASNFAGNLAPGPQDSGIYRVANSIETPFAAGTARIYFDGTNGSSGWDFVTGGDVSVVERGSLVAINHNLVNGAQIFPGDDNNAALRFTAGANTDFSLVVSTTGFADFDPAAFAQPNDFNFTFSAYSAAAGTSTLQWFFNGNPVGTAITITPGEFQAFNLDLPAGFYGQSAARLVGRVTGDIVIDHIQINGVRAAPVTFNQQPLGQTVTAGANVSFTVAVTGAASPTYRWRRNGVNLNDGPGISGTATATLSLSGVTPARAGDYTVVVNNNGVTAESAIATLVVNTLPVITEQPSPVSANPGETVIFEVEASGSPAPTYQWRKGGEDLADGPRVSGATTAQLILSDLMPEDEGDYSVLVTNAAGAVPSASAALTVTDDTFAPSIQQQPASTSVVLGGIATFRVNATGAPAPAYQWLKDGEPLADGEGVSGATTATLRVTALSTAASGAYSVRVFNSVDEVTSLAASLTVLVPPGLPDGSGPVGGSVNIGRSFTLSATPSGTGPFTYQWRKDGEDIPGQTGRELVLEPVSADSAGNYTVIITNAAGSFESAPVTVVVVRPATITTPPVSRTAGVGGTVTFSVVADGTPELSYQWRRNGEDIPDADSPTLTLTNLQLGDAGDYTVLVSNSGGSEESLPAALLVVARLAPSSNVTTLPPSTRFLLDSGFAADAGYRFQWLRSGKPIRGATSSTFLVESAVFADAGAYSVRVFSVTGRLLATRVVSRVSISVAGSYELFLRPDGVSEPLGLLRLTIGRTGVFSGRLQFIEGGAQAFRSRFEFPVQPYLGVQSVTLRRRGLPALVLTISLDAKSGLLEATLAEEDSAESAEGESRARFAGRADWAGNYSLMLSPVTAGEPSTPALLDVRVVPNNGVLRLAGRLADGTRVTAAVPSSVEARYLVALRPYGRRPGYLVGGLALVDSPSGYFADETSSGRWYWTRAARGASPVIDLELAPALAPR